MTTGNCVFCQIVAGKLKAWKIFENDTAIAILDTNPAAEGHCLVVPKRHVRFWHDLSDADTATTFSVAKTVAKRIKEVFKPDFVCIFVRGGRVSHAHIVLFPSHEGDRLSSFPQSVLGTAAVDLYDVQKKLVASKPSS